MKRVLELTSPFRPPPGGVFHFFSAVTSQTLSFSSYFTW